MSLDAHLVVPPHAPARHGVSGGTRRPSPGAARVPVPIAGPAPMRDLAPEIYRQRLVVEGIPTLTVGAEQISEYLATLSQVCGMRVLTDPVTHLSALYGWAGWIHWETSGAHFYAWDTPVRFIAVDLHACRQFSPTAVVEFTREFFALSEVEAREL